MKKAKPNTPKLYIPDADKKLKDMCQEGMKRLFGDKPPKAVKPRAHIVQFLRNDVCYLFGSGETNNTACFRDWVTPFGYMGYVK